MQTQMYFIVDDTVPLFDMFNIQFWNALHLLNRHCRFPCTESNECKLFSAREEWAILVCTVIDFVMIRLYSWRVEAITIIHYHVSEMQEEAAELIKDINYFVSRMSYNCLAHKKLIHVAQSRVSCRRVLAVEIFAMCDILCGPSVIKTHRAGNEYSISTKHKNLYLLLYLLTCGLCYKTSIVVSDRSVRLEEKTFWTFSGFPVWSLMSPRKILFTLRSKQDQGAQ